MNAASTLLNAAAAAVSTSVALTRAAADTVPEIWVGLPEVQVELGDSWSDPVDCLDVEDGPLPVTTRTLGYSMDYVTALDTSWVGERGMSYSCVDSAGNTAYGHRSVIVADTVPPDLALIGAGELSIAQGGTYTELGVTCVDTATNEDFAPTGWDISSFIQHSTRFEDEGFDEPGNVVDTSRVGLHTIRYSCFDRGANLASVVRTVAILDVTPPTLSLRGPSVVTLRIGGTWAHDPGAHCVDAVDGELPVHVRGWPLLEHLENETVSVDYSAQPGVYVIRYSCRDFAHNEAAVVEREIRVADAARFWRLLPTGNTSSAWEVGNVRFFSDQGCSEPLDAIPARRGRLQPTGVAFSSPRGRGRRAEIAFAAPIRGTVAAAGSSHWSSGAPCTVPGPPDEECHVGFEFDSPVMVNCVQLTQGTTPGSFSTGVRLQWRKLITEPYRDFARFEGPPYSHMSVGREPCGCAGGCGLDATSYVCIY